MGISQTLTPLIFENNLFARADDMNALLVNTNFAALQSREDWVRSDYDDVRIIATTPTRVIVEFTFQRVKSDGDVYMRIPALWVLAYEDGRWGLKFRSLMASTVD